MTSEERFDDAMADFSRADYEAAVQKLLVLLEHDPEHFDGRLALGMAYCRAGDLEKALSEGHKAEAMRPRDQLVHTNLSLFYVKMGDKEKAEHHGLQSRIASWRKKDGPAAGSEASPSDPDLAMAQPKPEAVKFTGKLPDMPWKKKKEEVTPSTPESGDAPEDKK